MRAFYYQLTFDGISQFDLIIRNDFLVPFKSDHLTPSQAGHMRTSVDVLRWDVHINIRRFNVDNLKIDQMLVWLVDCIVDYFVDFS